MNFATRAKDIANYIINMQSYNVDNLKLQKLLYYAQAVHLVSTNGKIALFPETIEAWDYGPVVPEIYHKYKKHGNDIIPADSSVEFFPEYNTDKGKLALESIDFTLEYYGMMTGGQLIVKSHRTGPWKDFFQVGKNVEITCESIYQYFKDVIVFEEEEDLQI